MKLPRPFVGLILCLLAGGLGRSVAEAAPSDATRQQLDALVTNVKGSTKHRYDAHDNTGLEMDTVKIIADPGGGYLAVYHTYLNSVYVVSLAASTDLMNWTYQCHLGTYAADPTIYACPNGAFVVAWEQTNTSGAKNHIRFAYYTSRGTLITGAAAQTYDAPMTLSKYAEGTPNIYSVTMTNNNINTSTIDTGGHYNNNTSRLDRQQRGTLTNFNSWTMAARSDYDNAILYWGVQGNIGDRDFLTFNGYQFNILEGQSTAKDFGSWKLYDFDFQTGNADQLSLVTDGGSSSFGNPTATYLVGPDGNPCLVCSAFIFSQNSASGEAGPLIYYTTLPAAPAITNGPTPASASVGTPYRFTYTHTGYPAPSFTLASGTLPAGLTLSTTGVLSGTPTQGGTYSGTIQASNGQGAVATQAFTIVVAQTYAQWANTYFSGASPSVSAATATPQDDQVSNLLKYAFDVNPTRPMAATDLASLPKTGPDRTITPSTTYLTVTYRQNPTVTGLAVNVQTSADLQSWVTVSPDITRNAGTDGATGDPIIEVEVDSQQAAREFIRLNVTSNS